MLLYTTVLFVVIICSYIKWFATITELCRDANGNWTMQNMSLAIEANTSNACSMIQAAVNFGVPKATLRLYLKKSYNNKYRDTSTAGDILMKKTTTHCYLTCERFLFKRENF